MKFIPTACYGTISEIKGEGRPWKMNSVHNRLQTEGKAQHLPSYDWSRCCTGATKDKKDLLSLTFGVDMHSIMMTQTREPENSMVTETQREASYILIDQETQKGLVIVSGHSSRPNHTGLCLSAMSSVPEVLYPPPNDQQLSIKYRYRSLWGILEFKIHQKVC